jgi:hypothetical protein
MQKEIVKLTKSQEALYLSWIKDFRAVLTSVNQVIDELLSVRMRGLADEAGVNILDGDWRFDVPSMSFRKIKNSAPVDTQEEIKEAEIVDIGEVK